MKIIALLCLLLAPASQAFLIVHHAGKEPPSVVGLVEGKAHHFVCPGAEEVSLPRDLSELTRYCKHPSYSIPQRNFLRSLFAFFGVNDGNPSIELADWYMEAESDARVGREQASTKNILTRVTALHNSLGKYLPAREHATLNYIPGHSLSTIMGEAFFPVYSQAPVFWAVHEGGCRAGWIEAPLSRVLDSGDGLARWLAAEMVKKVRLWHGSFTLDLVRNQKVSTFRRENLLWLVDQVYPGSPSVDLFRPFDPKDFGGAIKITDGSAAPFLCWKKFSSLPQRNYVPSVLTKDSVYLREMSEKDRLAQKDFTERLILDGAAIDAKLEGLLFDLRPIQSTEPLYPALLLKAGGGFRDKGLVEKEFQEAVSKYRNRTRELERLTANARTRSEAISNSLGFYSNTSAVLLNQQLSLGYDFTNPAVNAQRKLIDERLEQNSKAWDAQLRASTKASDEYIELLNELSRHQATPEPQ